MFTFLGPDAPLWTRDWKSLTGTVWNTVQVKMTVWVTTGHLTSTQLISWSLWQVTQESKQRTAIGKRLHWHYNEVFSWAHILENGKRESGVHLLKLCVKSAEKHEALTILMNNAEHTRELGENKKVVYCCQSFFRISPYLCSPAWHVGNMTLCVTNQNIRICC